MRDVSASGSAINEKMVRVAIIGTGRKPEIARMHPAQVCAISELYECVAIANVKDLASLEDIEAVRRLAKEYEPITFMGMKVKQDAGMPPDLIEFMDENGDPIAQIRNLAIPTGLEAT